MPRHAKEISMAVTIDKLASAEPIR